MNTTQRIATTSCSNCQRYTAVIREADGTNWLHDLTLNGYDATDRRHVCGESDRRRA